MNLQLITLSNKDDQQLRVLRDSAEAKGLPVKILGLGVDWPRNTIKLRILNDYLTGQDLKDQDILLVVDAYDVFVNISESEILSAYKKLDSDIVFSAEANYYFRDPQLSLQYWLEYPRQEGSIYHFLNSGSFMGRVASLKQLLLNIAEAYEVDYADDEQLARIRSDQYLYSRYYVDLCLGKYQADFTMMLDASQSLFGCSGGRMVVKDWPSHSEVQDYLFFKYERRMLKTFGLEREQGNCRDLAFNVMDRTFDNTLTNSQPGVIHLPGSYQQFPIILDRMMGKSRRSQRMSVQLLLAILLSTIAYFRSVVNYFYIRTKNNGSVKVVEVFPNAIRKDATIKKDTLRVGSLTGLFPSDNPFAWKRNA